MREPACLLVAIAFVNFAAIPVARAQKGQPPSAKIRSAESVYIDDQTGAAAVGKKAVGELRKWGRFRIANDRTEADLVMLLSSDPYTGQKIIVSGGQTGTIGPNGDVREDRVPTFGKLAPVRYAYLTVIDARTGEALWSGSHRWGGLLTGFNSAGERLVKRFEKEMKK
jgi:hypothetical protein